MIFLSRPENVTAAVGVVAVGGVVAGAELDQVVLEVVGRPRPIDPELVAVVGVAPA